ncbi:DUF4332 domain-containing protein [Crateriforma conspicua]|uniref:DUF4332 domain-containing protein n=1 Tax=Crateriforma conspicua TaxID=2527996 RepID=UPI00118BED8D|nr:DUF4332 domain-containing protein [Crateriforma conspicua]QDV66121.1 50S ribosomal protein L21/unknown domain fusion protein [Crateriforma conspicua]
MSLLLTILRAAHCRSTHHFFALDALPLVQTAAGKRLAGWLLKHHGRYLTGAKDPDTRFRDFQNHVVHVEDGYWGGAPRVAHQWYDRMFRYVRDGRYSDAAHAAGVISHYFTDPIQPLHTAQTAREKVLHRPIEWSITLSYEDIYRRWLRDESRVVFQLSEGPQWLGEAILHAAKFAHRRYNTLVDSYRLDLGAKDPPAGLDDPTRDVLADLLGIAITGWARALERMALETELALGQPIPKANLSLSAVMAAIQTPAKWWIKRIADRDEQDAVSALISEFTRTGQVLENLPAEIDIVDRVMRIRRDEQIWKQRRIAQAESKQTAVAIDETITTESAKSSAGQSAAAPSTIPFPANRSESNDTTRTADSDQTVAAEQAGRQPREASENSTPSLHAGDDLVDAPSIGPKTAHRFAEIGVQTVAQFLAKSPEELAGRLATRWMTADTIRTWQHQASLMCEMPKMLAREIQLLVGAGYVTMRDIAGADASELHREIEAFAATSAGRRYLRGGSPPSIQRVTQWTQLPQKPRRRAA